MVPLVGSTIRLIIRSDVVFPQPDGPTKTVMEPLSMRRLRLSTAAWFAWNRLVTWLYSIMVEVLAVCVEGVCLPWMVSGGAPEHLTLPSWWFPHCWRYSR